MRGLERMISVFILTYNEENNLEECIRTAALISDDIHIVDSFSTDRTLEIGAAHGCTVHQRKFDTFARQCNWGLETVAFRHDWIMRLDADERLTPELVAELKTFIQTAPADVGGMVVKKRMYYMGRWIRHGRVYPMLRLCVYRRGSGYYEDVEEEQYILKTGRSVISKCDFYEDNLNNDLPFFIHKHVEYAEDESDEFIQKSSVAEMKPSLFGNKIERTRWLKLNIYNRAPLGLRALLYFLYRYVILLGFLDGRPGLIFHLLQGFWYRFYVDARIYEKQHPRK
jgi:glycosyltransferase involved in cell wall biosynthesis